VEKIEIIQKICQNEHRSELLIHFGAKEVRYRSKYTIFLSRAPASETHFTFFSSKVQCTNYFHNVQVSCYCCITWYENRTIFSLLYSHLRWSFCGVMLLHVVRDGAGSFAVLIFLHYSILAFGRGHTIKQLPWGPGITRPLHAPELDQVYRSWWKLQASASQQESVLGLFHLFCLNGSRTLRGPLASVDRVNVDLDTF